MNQEQILYSSFPKDYYNDVNKVLHLIKNQWIDIRSTEENFQKILLNNEILYIPYRVYLNVESVDISELNLIQKTIYHCILLRHHNGYIRQKSLEELLNSDSNFIIPFSIQLLGEYVIEIIEILEKHIDKNIETYIAFCKENQRNFELINTRAISYWNEYYRKIYSELNKYPGIKLLKKITNHELH